MSIGAADHLIDKFSILTDLKFHPSAGLYFDHHESNKPAKPVCGSWENKGSSVHVIYDYFGAQPEIAKFSQLLEDVDKVDSGNLSREEVLNPSTVIKLGMLLSREKLDLCKYLVDFFKLKSPKDLDADQKIREVISHWDSGVEKFLQNMPKYLMKRGVLGIYDSRKFHNGHIHSFIITAHNPDIKVLAVIKASKNIIRINLYRNSFYKNNNQFNWLKLQKINKTIRRT
jgi:hypothetical protein